MDPTLTITPPPPSPSSNRKTIIIVSILFLLFLLLPTIIFMLLPKPTVISGPPLLTPTPSSSLPSITPTPTTPTPPTAPTPKVQSLSLLLLGKGGEGHSGGHLTDTITQLVFYPKQLKLIIIGIPRDTYIEAGSPRRWMKLNHSFAESPQETMLAVQTITGLKVDHYAIVDFNQFTKLIDHLGGVTVQIKTPFTDPYYPIKGEENNTCGFSPEKITSLHQQYSGFNLEKQFTCRYEQLSFKEGPAKMDGTTALKYVRSRHSGTHGSDFARLERAADLITSLIQNLTAKLTLTSVQNLYQELKPYLKTSLTPQELTSHDPSTLQNTTIKTIPLNSQLFINGKSPLGEFILEPSAGRGGWGPIQQYITQNL